MEEVVSPVTPSSPNRANFSYPARAPPQGVPRQVPGNGIHPDHQRMDSQQHQEGIPPVPPVPGQQQPPRRSSIPQMPAYQQQQSGMPPMPNQQPSSIPPSLQSGINTNNVNDSDRPVPYRAGHDLNKQSTMANLKAAAAGIHVSTSHTTTSSYVNILTLFYRAQEKPSAEPSTTHSTAATPPRTPKTKPSSTKAGRKSKPHAPANTLPNSSSSSSSSNNHTWGTTHLCRTRSHRDLRLGLHHPLLLSRV